MRIVYLQVWLINAHTGGVPIHGSPATCAVVHSSLDHRNTMRISLIFVFIALITFIVEPSFAGSKPINFIGPRPGVIHVYEGYSGGATKVWGLARTPTDELVTVVEASLPPHIFSNNEEPENPKKSYLLHRYIVDQCQVISKDRTGTHVLLDICNDEWIYQAKLYVGISNEKRLKTAKSDDFHDIICKIISRDVVFFHKKQREVIHVGYSFMNKNMEQQTLGSVYFVEGIGPLIGKLDEPFRCIQANPVELEEMRRFIQKSTDDILK